MNLLDEDITEAAADNKTGSPVRAGGRNAARAAALAQREKQAAFDTLFGDPS